MDIARERRVHIEGEIVSSETYFVHRVRRRAFVLYIHLNEKNVSRESRDKQVDAKAIVFETFCRQFLLFLGLNGGCFSHENAPLLRSRLFSSISPDLSTNYIVTNYIHYISV